MNKSCTDDTSIRNHRGSRALSGFALAAALSLSGLTLPANAGEVFSGDFSKGSIEVAGWTAQGDWSIINYADKKPDLANNPGPVAKFAANGKTTGTLTKKFDPISNPASLTLTFEAGYGWGTPNHSQPLQVMLLDAEGNGYVFDIHRSNSKWGAQWGAVAKYVPDEPLTYATSAIDTTQAPVMKEGGLRAFIITRDSAGRWTFNGAGWIGGPLTFTDTTTSAFSQVVLVGRPNNDELLFGKVKLEATK